MSDISRRVCEGFCPALEVDDKRKGALCDELRARQAARLADAGIAMVMSAESVANNPATELVLATETDGPNPDKDIIF